MNCYFAGVNGKAMFGVRQVSVLGDVINDDDDDDADRQTERLTLYFNTTFLQVQNAGFHKAVHAITYQNMINNYRNCRYTKLKIDLISALETEVSHRFPKKSRGGCASIIVGRKFHRLAPRWEKKGGGEMS